MQYLVTSSEMKEYDKNTIEQIGIPGLVLMERAAMAVRDEIHKFAEAPSVCASATINTQEVMQRTAGTRCKILVVAGSGNNGADGLALARLLSEEHYDVSVMECGNVAHMTDSYRKQREILQYYDVKFLDTIEDADSDYAVVADGIFGVGLSRTINEEYKKVIEWMNRLGGYKIAIDIPSGVDGSDGQVLGAAFRADTTVTFGFPKRGLYLFPGAEYAGKIVTANIGIDEHGFLGRKPGMFTYNESPMELLPPRKKNGNKGTFGKVLVIAGWETMAGAAIMSAKAVLKTGAGMVKVFCSEQNRAILQCAVPEVMYGNRESLTQDIVWADVVVAGPGLGQSGEASEVLQAVIAHIKENGKTLLLDADALNLISGNRELQKELAIRSFENTMAEYPGLIMTPHIGELSRLSGYDIAYIKSHITEVAKEMAEKYHSVMVCKDARTVVYEEGQPYYLNLSGNSGMATAGSGDVLAGMIAALRAQGQSAFRAACVGVYLHGLAGNAAAEKHTEYGMTATDLIAQIM